MYSSPKLFVWIVSCGCFSISGWYMKWAKSALPSWSEEGNFLRNHWKNKNIIVSLATQFLWSHFLWSQMSTILDLSFAAALSWNSSAVSVVKKMRHGYCCQISVLQIYCFHPPCLADQHCLFLPWPKEGKVQGRIEHLSSVCCFWYLCSSARTPSLTRLNRW